MDTHGRIQSNQFLLRLQSSLLHNSENKIHLSAKTKSLTAEINISSSLLLKYLLQHSGSRAVPQTRQDKCASTHTHTRTLLSFC